MRNILKSLVFITLSIAGIAANAQDSATERAQATAERFFTQRAGETRNNANLLKKVWDSNILNVTRGAAEEPTFHAFAANNGKGFVIVANEGTESPVIGYSFDDILPNADNIPEGFKNYLAEFDREIRRARGSVTRAAVTDQATLGNSVVELNTAKWAQGAPFNQLCPQKNGNTTLTGCIATAFAIVMRHHKWPASGTGNVYNPITGEKIMLGHTYDWDNMPLEYTSGNYTEKQATEVATVMRDVGFAYNLDYGTSSTGGTENATKLRDYFGYNNLSELSGTSSGATQRFVVNNDDLWIKKIKESLDNSCPVPYVAVNKGTGSDAKHIFIVDGYTDNNYFHFNWGWGGFCNGFYSLAKMDPTQDDDYASSTTGHKAFFNLKPLKTTNYYTISASSNDERGGTATVNDATNAELEEGAAVTLSAVANYGYIFQNWTLNGNIVSQNATYSTTATADAHYIANFVVAAADAKATITVVANGSGDARVIGGEGGGTSTVAQRGATVTLVATPKSGHRFINWTSGDEIISTNANYTVTVSVNKEYTANFEPINEEKVTITLKGSGGYYSVGNDATAMIRTQEVAAYTKVTISAKESSSEKKFAYWSTKNTVANNGIIVSNNNPMQFIATQDTVIYVNFVAAETDLNVEVNAISSDGGTATVEKKSSVSAPLGSTVNLSAEAHIGYHFVSWTTDEGTFISSEPVCNVLVTAATTFKANFAVTSDIDVPQEADNKNVIYDLQGRLVDTVTSKGIYIINGKKVLLK